MYQALWYLWTGKAMTSWPHLNKKLHFSKILKWFLCPLKSEKYLSRTQLGSVTSLSPLAWERVYSRVPWSPGVGPTTETCWPSPSSLEFWRAAICCCLTSLGFSLHIILSKRQMSKWMNGSEEKWRHSLKSQPVSLLGAHLKPCTWHSSQLLKLPSRWENDFSEHT